MNEFLTSRRVGKTFSLEEKRKQVDFFNKHYPVGTQIIVYNNGRAVTTTTASEAELLGGSTIAIRLNGIDGMFDLGRVSLVERTSIQSESELERTQSFPV